MRALFWLIGAFSAMLMLCGCNLDAPVASAPPQSQPLAPQPVKLANLPAGAACTKKINRYQAVLAADLKSGNLEQKVYDEIEQELGLAAADCTDGLGREALKLVHDSEARHGYHI